MVGKSPSCRLCNGLEKKDESDVRLALEIKPNELVAPVSRGCACCAVILAALQQFGKVAWGNSASPEGESSSWDPVDGVTKVIAYGLSSDEDTLFLELYPKDDSKMKRTLEVFFPESEMGRSTLSQRLTRRKSQSKADSPRVGAVRCRPSLAGHPLSPGGLQWVHMKLQTCLERHMACPREKETNLPKRVLEFQESSPGGPISVRLRTDQATQRFAALSHCWGTNPTCTTTKETVQRHMNGILWSEIPQTFQDAIRFCLAIGVSYLWVDALCIVQDDPIDWQVESAKMASIYQNAYIHLRRRNQAPVTEGIFQSYISQPWCQNTAYRSPRNMLLSGDA